MDAFVINLDSRPDRWAEVVKQKSRLNCNVVRVPAVTISKRTLSGSMVTPGVQAIWDSHVLAMKTFLESGEKLCIILEDDFSFTGADLSIFFQFASEMDMDFLQIGFLTTSIFEWLSIARTNIVDSLLKILARISDMKYINSIKFFNKLLIREQRGIHQKFVVGDIRPGAHCYLISRKFAESCLKLNYPTAISADGFFMALSWMRTFKMFRLRKSIAQQSNSTSSVESRFLRDI
jgi:GR25 family glycosyltransferase involved in LPS biosynthesis